jgi:eukaryotic-like serine/threonine-protein kinase
MEGDPTLSQDRDQRLRARQRSLQATRPPTQVPGYDLEQLIGSGAFGEVWYGVERNTGRRVAIKFYAHRGGLDWSLLSREVEKLTFLFADRHVVQLVGVGWDADPPYYVMEYLERGSLADRLHEEPLSGSEAVNIFREVVVGLIHAHGKGVLHCDLKPGNVLLDQDNRPRLADFGQSRLSNEQAPALGTLFYMPPEQANLDAVPDVRWDVYALGALLYCMLTGSPPHRDDAGFAELDGIEDFGHRLTEYRRIIRRAPIPTDHRQLRGVDRGLAEIIERCLAPDPKNRFANVQAVLDALDARDARRARRPAMLLGAFGPALVLLVVSVFAWTGFSRALQRSKEELLTQALKTNRFAAQSVAKAVAAGVDRRCRAVEGMIGSEDLRRQFMLVCNDSELTELSVLLSDPETNEEQLESLRAQFREHPQRRALQAALKATVARAGSNGNVNSWFLNDARGVQVARVPEQVSTSTVGRCYAWRSYFHGGATDLKPSERYSPGAHITQSGPSAAYRSEATGIWNVAISTPIWDANQEDVFLGIGGLTVGVGDLVEPVEADGTAQFAVLVEMPTASIPGHILNHPIMESAGPGKASRPDAARQLLIEEDQFPATLARKAFYEDPVGIVDSDYRGRWLAETAGVQLRGTDWVVIVQESYDTAIGSTLRDLKAGLVAYGWSALAMVTLVVLGLWGVAYRLLEQGGSTRGASLLLSDSETPVTSDSSAVSAAAKDVRCEAGRRPESK